MPEEIPPADNADGDAAPIACFRCGLCCTRFQPRPEPGEQVRLADGLGLTLEEFLLRYTQVTPVGYLLRRTDSGCIFLERHENGVTAHCNVHGFRPGACADWQASLAQPECREGLAILRAAGINPDLVAEG